MTTATESTTRTDWSIDGAHSDVGFAVRHMMISTVKGRFSDVQGTISLDPSAGELAARVEIATASVDTRVEQRDAHLRAPDFFDVEEFPRMVFQSRRTVGWMGIPGSSFQLIGDLTIKDVTREVLLDATFEGMGQDPWGGERAGFTATAKIDRRDFGLNWNQALETGGVLVSPEVRISLDVQAVKQADLGGPQG